MKNGFIYNIIKVTLDNLRFITLVELFKFAGHQLNPKKNNDNYKIAFSRTSVDIFIVLKWLFVLLLAKNNCSSPLLVAVIWYLLLTNIYSYFYYHIWNDEALSTESFSPDRTRRRFINLMLAVGYSNLSFAYLFKVSYTMNFEWSNNNATFTKSIWYSISNSLAANYDAVRPITDLGNNIAMTQLVITFIFITIILGKSIPQTNSTT